MSSNITSTYFKNISRDDNFTSILPDWSSLSVCFRHMGMACSFMFKISFWKHAQPSGTPLPYQTASQVTVLANVPERQMSILQKSQPCFFPSLLPLEQKSLSFVCLLCPRWSPPIRSSGHSLLLLCLQTAGSEGHLP